MPWSHKEFQAHHEQSLDPARNFSLPEGVKGGRRLAAGNVRVRVAAERIKKKNTKYEQQMVAVAPAWILPANNVQPDFGEPLHVGNPRLPAAHGGLVAHGSVAQSVKGAKALMIHHVLGAGRLYSEPSAKAKSGSTPTLLGAALGVAVSAVFVALWAKTRRTSVGGEFLGDQEE